MTDMTPEIQKDAARMQAFLFHYGEPVEIRKIAKVLKMKEAECSAALDALENELSGNPASGLVLMRGEGTAQLATKPEFQEIRRGIVEDEWKSELTPAAQETLSIIAYLGPISKVMVDYVRGVNSGFILRNLLVRGLVEREPSVEHPHSYDYRVTNEFLKHMGLSGTSALPEYETYRGMLAELSMGGEPAEEKPVETANETA